VTKTDRFKQRWKFLVRLQLQQCTSCLAVILEGFPGGIWRKAEEGFEGVYRGLGKQGRLGHNRHFVFLLEEADDISMGQGISELRGPPWQTSSMKLLPLHVLTDHSLVEASGFLLLATSSSHFVGHL